MLRLVATTGMGSPSSLPAPGTPVSGIRVVGTDNCGNSSQSGQ